MVLRAAGNRFGDPLGAARRHPIPAYWGGLLGHELSPPFNKLIGAYGSDDKRLW